MTIKRKSLSPDALKKIAAVPRKTLDKRKTFTWTGGFENWSKGWVERHFWRVRHRFGSKEDALQECAAIFAECVNYYAETVNNPAWMMALYKTSVARFWHKSADEDRRIRLALEHAERDALMISHDHGVAPLYAALNAASAELKTVLRTIAVAPAELMDMIFVQGGEARLNRRLCRFSKVEGEPDVIGELRALLS